MHFNTEIPSLQRRPSYKGQPSGATAIVMFVAVVFFGCVANREAAAAPATAADPITITEKDAGKSFSMAIGQALYARLASNPSTGYQWNVQGSAAPLELVKSDFARNPQGSNAPGASGTQQLQFTAKAAGTVSLTFEYRRPWEKDVPPAKTVTVTIVVK